MLHWRERAQNKLESLNIKNKRFKPVLSMFALFLSLIFDAMESHLRGTCFEEFVRDYNLLLESTS